MKEGGGGWRGRGYCGILQRTNTRFLPFNQKCGLHHLLVKVRLHYIKWHFFQKVSYLEYSFIGTSYINHLFFENHWLFALNSIMTLYFHSLVFLFLSPFFEKSICVKIWRPILSHYIRPRKRVKRPPEKSYQVFFKKAKLMVQPHFR